MDKPATASTTALLGTAGEINFIDKPKENNFGQDTKPPVFTSFRFASFQVNIDVHMVWNMCAIAGIFSSIKMSEAKTHYFEADYIMAFAVLISSMVGIISALWTGGTSRFIKFVTIVSLLCFELFVYFVLRRKTDPTTSTLCGIAMALGIILVLSDHLRTFVNQWRSARSHPIVYIVTPAATSIGSYV